MTAKSVFCIPFSTLDVYSVDVAESCVYLSNYIIYHSMDLCTNALIQQCGVGCTSETKACMINALNWSLVAHY